MRLVATHSDMATLYATALPVYIKTGIEYELLDPKLGEFDLEQLAADVRAAFEAYSPDTLDSMWAYKSEIMQKIINCNGGNCYDRRRAPEA